MIKPIFLTAATIAIAGIPITAGAYHLSRETIWDKLQDDAIPEGDASLERLWEKIKERLAKGENEGVLKRIQSVDLKTWCTNSYRKTYKSWFLSPKDDLLNDMKLACVWKIEDQLEGSKKLTFNGEENKSYFEKKVSELESHSRKKGILEATLRNIKKMRGGERWKKLMDWCREIYQKGYQGENNRWKLVKIYCSK